MTRLDRRTRRSERILGKIKGRHAASNPPPSFADFLREEFGRLPEDASRMDAMIAFEKASIRFEVASG